MISVYCFLKVSRKVFKDVKRSNVLMTKQDSIELLMYFYLTGIGKPKSI